DHCRGVGRDRAGPARMTARWRLAKPDHAGRLGPLKRLGRIVRVPAQPDDGCTVPADAPARANLHAVRGVLIRQATEGLPTGALVGPPRRTEDARRIRDS